MKKNSKRRKKTDTRPDSRPETKQWTRLTFPEDRYLQKLVNLGLL